MTLRSRLARAEAAAGRHVGLHEIIIKGGLPGSAPLDTACVTTGEQIERGADESVGAFRGRVRALAAALDVSIVTYGGLPT
jgi:hypothetical protein